MTHSVKSGTENIRNIAILGHAGAGKTTLVEALLAKAGAIPSAGSVEKGSTVCDFTDQEKRLRHSLDVAVCHLQNGSGRSISSTLPATPISWEEPWPCCRPWKRPRS